MSATVSPVAKPFRPQFTLRRLLVAIFLLGIALGIGRWVYVTVVVPRQVAVELQAMGARLHYTRSTNLVPTQNWTSHDLPPVGYHVSRVDLALPFQSDDEAERANYLLRQLHQLTSLQVSERPISNRGSQSSPFLCPSHPPPDWWELADRHLGIALRDVTTDELLHDIPDYKHHAATYVRSTGSVRSASFTLGRLSVEDLRAICAAPHLEELALLNASLTDEHLAVLEAARHLKKLKLGGYMPLGRVAARLAQRTDLELGLSPHLVSDHDLKVCVATLPNLTELSLFLHEPSDDAVAALADAPRLRVLTLQDAAVSDAAVMALAKSKSLQNVNLGGTDVSDEAILRLAECPTLRELHVTLWRGDGLKSWLPERVSVEDHYPGRKNAALDRAQWRAVIEKHQATAVGTSQP